MAEIETEIDLTVEVETILEIATEIEVEIEIGEIVETTAEVDQIQEMVEETNKDLVQVKDIMTRKTTLTTVIEQVTPICRCFKLENYLKKQGKKIFLCDDDDVHDIAHTVQHPNAKINSLKVSNSTNN